MFLLGNRINKIIYYFLVILVLISVIIFWGFSLPNVLHADDDDGGDKDKDKDKGDKDKGDKDKDKDKGDKDKDKDLKTFHITANCNDGGSISPKGSQEITEGGSITFTCAADEGYNLIWLRVDNEKIEGINSYTFDSVDSNHTIHAQFKKTESSDENQDEEDSDDEDEDIFPGDGSADMPSGGDENSENGTESSVEIISYYDYYKSNSTNNSNLLKYDEIKSQSIISQNKTEGIKNNPNYKEYNDAGRIDDIKDLFNIIEINDTNQLLDINAIVKENEIIEILDVEDLINEGNFIELGIERLDLSNYNNPFARSLSFIWSKIKDFSYYYNS